jgi:hypothetical protein
MANMPTIIFFFPLYSLLFFRNRYRPVIEKRYNYCDRVLRTGQSVFLS